MRLLPAENTSAIMDAVNDIFSDRQRNPFRFIRQNARVLTGEEEGAFAWLAANYLAGYFTGGKGFEIWSKHKNGNVVIWKMKSSLDAPKMVIFYNVWCNQW